MNELVKSVGERLEHLLTLPANWDSYGADLISERVVADVRNFVAKLPAGVPVPFVAPTNDGGVQLEWNRSYLKYGLYLEFEFVPHRPRFVEYIITNPLDEDGYSTGDFYIGDIDRAMRFIKQVVGEVDDDEIDHDPFYGDGD